MRVLFFIIALGITVLMVVHVSLRGFQVLQPVSNFRTWYVYANILLFITMIVGMVDGSWMPLKLGKIVSFVGYSYMIVMIYLLLSFLAVDLVRLFNLLFHFASPAGMNTFRLWAFTVSLVVIAIAMIKGNYQFNHPAVVHLAIHAEKPAQNKHIKIVAVSDLHLGITIDKSYLKKYVNLINVQHPDLILIGGDITDRSAKELVKQNMAEEFRKLKAPLGIFAVTGNHEYYSGDPGFISDYLKSAGIITLHDSAAFVDSSLYVVGRNDLTSHNRKPLDEIMKNVDETKPIILLDHQPHHLEVAEHNNVDFQFSGHTHNGQFFPGNLIVKKIFEDGYGYLKKGKTNYYVSSGLGIWGPHYRIKTQSELVVVDFEF